MNRPFPRISWPARGIPFHALIRFTLIAGLILYLFPAVSSSQSPAPGNSEAQDVLRYLNRTLDWHRQWVVEQQLASEPGETMAASDDRRLADQVLRLGFDYARAEAQALSTQPASNQPSPAPGESSHYESLRQFATRLDQQAAQTQAEVEGLRRRLETASPAQRKNLQTRLEETQSELDLLNARKDAVRSMVAFVSGASANGLGASGLRAQIEALARSVPADISQSAASESAAHPSAPQPVVESASSTPSSPSGIWGLASSLFALSSKIDTLDNRIHATDELIKANGDLRSPLVSRLKALSRRGDALANEADAANDSTLASEKQQLDALTAQFKQISATVLPLSKQGVLLTLYRTSLTNWQNQVREHYHAHLRSLIVRIALLLLILAAVFVFSELWRRTIFRYVQDPRRRHQFLLLRKIALWFIIAVIFIVSFVSQLGSFATFAGLLTAGVAVALQNVILSIVGYFFLIGRFGVRVGDRVQISGVTGEVVDIGLVRFHVMELAGNGVDAPTGRIVAFSNSIVFQPTAGLFRQIPGTHFVWHEIRLTLAPESDYHAVEKRLLGTVESVFADYRDEMERQHDQLQRTVSVPLAHGLQPRSWLRITPAGLEAVIRYPVDLGHASEIDDRVTRELLKEVDREPKLNLIGTGGSAIKITTDLTSNVAS
jgi:small-conductance mechanosensitive channel